MAFPILGAVAAQIAPQLLSQVLPAVSQLLGGLGGGQGAGQGTGLGSSPFGQGLPQPQQNPFELNPYQATAMDHNAMIQEQVRAQQAQNQTFQAPKIPAQEANQLKMQLAVLNTRR